tara:strand:+ start:466 stop:882 length:417 start_codon:yes stop_codon:yes gene_type:complete
MPNTYYNNNNSYSNSNSNSYSNSSNKHKPKHKQGNKNKQQGKNGNKCKAKRNNNYYRDNNNYRDNRNIYEVCGMVQRYIGDTCHKYQLEPSVLYEELHYQLPAEWVDGLRYIIRNSARIQVKREFDISSSESSEESAI